MTQNRGIENVQFYREITPDFFYYLGLMATDGSLSGRSVQLGLTDKDVIDWVVQKLGYLNTVTESPGKKVQHRTRYWVRFHNREAANVLRFYGVKDRKTYTLRVNLHDIPIGMYRHFIRGVFDGDGSINTKKHGVEAYITSRSSEFITQIRDIINNALHFGYDVTRVDRTNGTHYFCYRMYGVPHVGRFGRWIYEGDYYRMSRKKAELAGIIEEASARKLRGAYWKKDKHKWRAQIKVDRKCIFLGYYKTEEEAAQAYDKAAVKHFGRRAILNFPELHCGDCLEL
ncbi:hypothetical protein JZ785_10650 [Alicyclobacillus curvatus]|nr:hypothetical protein JZ785_10650 [Alicyclobacillus curvatus]